MTEYELFEEIFENDLRLLEEIIDESAAQYPADENECAWYRSQLVNELVRRDQESK